MIQIHLRINFCDHYWLNDGKTIDSDPYVSALQSSQHKQNCERKKNNYNKKYLSRLLIVNYIIT